MDTAVNPDWKKVAMACQKIIEETFPDDKGEQAVMGIVTALYCGRKSGMTADAFADLLESNATRLRERKWT